MLAHRQRRWSNIEPALGECLVFVGSDSGLKLDQVEWFNAELKQPGVFGYICWSPLCNLVHFPIRFVNYYITTILLAIN